MENTNHNGIDSPKSGVNLIYEELVKIRKLLESIVTAILSPTTTDDTEDTAEESKVPEPPQKIPWSRLKGIIDDAGYNIANDKNSTTKEKVDAWVDLLKWALPLIPDDDQNAIELIQNGISNPSTVILYPKDKTLYGHNRIDCTLCSDENSNYYFTMFDHPEGERIFNTDQIPPTIESIEFQLAFKLPPQENSQ